MSDSTQKKTVFLSGNEAVAEVREISRSRKLGTYQGMVTNKDGAILAQFQAMAYLKEKRSHAER